MSFVDDVILRPRTDRDLSKIVSWVHDRRALYLFSGPRLQWPLTEAQLREMEQVEGLTAWVVARPTGEAIGHFDLTQVDDEARLGRVIIQPTMRGRGLARTLLRLALSQARVLGAERVRLNVISDNEPAISAYTRAGFSVIPHAAERPDVTVMVKKVS